MSQAWNVLNEPLLSIETGGGERQDADLPTVLAMLSRGEALEFAALQAHHELSWHAFLVQLAGLALRGVEPPDPPATAAAWREALEGLVDDQSAWCLLVEDLDRPALLQPPVPAGTFQKLKNQTAHADRLDVLVTAKNHEVKAERFNPCGRPENWLYTLVALQTTEGFSGRGNYGIARMNGGFASRPCVALAPPDLSWTGRFRRDLSVLLEQRSAMIEGWHYQPKEGLALVWTEPWSGEKGEELSLQELDPFFIEVCRRVRPVENGGEIRAHYGATTARRIDADEYKGNLGDPWTPIRKKDSVALTVSESGFSYRQARDLLFGSDYQRSAAQKPRPGDADEVTAVVQVLVRGQGKTGGFHQRWVPIPSRIGENSRGDDEILAELAELSVLRIEEVKNTQRKILHPALCALLQGGNEKLNFKDEGSRPWLNRLDREVDRIFFEELFRDMQEAEGDERHERWQGKLYELAEELFLQAQKTLVRNDVRRYKAIARANSLFYGSARNVLKFHFAKAPESKGSEESMEAS